MLDCNSHPSSSLMVATMLIEGCDKNHCTSSADVAVSIKIQVLKVMQYVSMLGQ